MLKSCHLAPLSAVLLIGVIIAGTAPTDALTLEQAIERPVLNGSTRPNKGSDFALPGLSSEKHNPYSERFARLLHLAHVQAAAQGCGDIEVVQDAVQRLFAQDGFGPLSPSELAFVGGRISDFKERLKARAGEEICEWAYENYGPAGAMYAGLVRSKPIESRDPETTSAIPSRGPTRPSHPGD